MLDVICVNLDYMCCLRLLMFTFPHANGHTVWYENMYSMIRTYRTASKIPRLGNKLDRILSKGGSRVEAKQPLSDLGHLVFCGD